MKNCSWIITCAILVLFGAMSAATAKQNDRLKDYKVKSLPSGETAPGVDAAAGGTIRTLTVTDTFNLASFDWDSAINTRDPEGWVAHDLTEQLDTFFHIADSMELDGGTFGKLLVLEGNQSLWCGVDASAAAPYCGYATLPGYGNNWDQSFTSKTFACDSIRISYKVCWDSEPLYDKTVVQYWNEGTSKWVALPVNGGANLYWDIGILDESFAIPVPAGTTQLRYRFTSDGAWSDEDGNRASDGAVVVDSITVECYNGGVLTTTYFEDFEDETPGATATNDSCWVGGVGVSFGDFADLYPASIVLQNDICHFEHSHVWGFFDDPVVTNYACGGFPDQGAVPFESGNGLYMTNEIWSPKIPYVGAGDDVRLTFQVYRDNPLDNLIFWVWHVRSWVNGCPQAWEDQNFVYFSPARAWGPQTESIGSLIDAGATDIQLALGVWDMCAVWCNVFGTGVCHSHAPMFDEVEVTRINVTGPQFTVRHLDLFQDNFAEDGSLTGTSRADAANDIAPSTTTMIVPGDSATISVADPSFGLITDPLSGVGPAVYMYVSVWPPNQAGKSGPELEAPEVDPGVGLRYPLVDSLVHGGATWYCFRADSARSGGNTVQDRFCFDLNDAVFTPGDTICYVFCAEGGGGDRRYWSRRMSGQAEDFMTGDLSEALTSPCEFTILPAGGWLRGGEYLYVDDADDRAGPPQFYFDSVIQTYSIADQVDRYDVLSPSSVVGNGLASRVKNIFTQILGPYRIIIWNSADLSDGTIGDGTGNPEKSNDFNLLYTFLDQSPNNPGLYISGDNIAEEWVGLVGASAILLRTVYVNFNLLSGDHVAAGEGVSPFLFATGQCFTHAGIPDSLIAYGGCPQVNSFDVLQATMFSVPEFSYPNGAGDAVISETLFNSGGSQARTILSGFSFHNIRDKAPVYPIARQEHLFDILVWLQANVVIGSGIDDDAPQFANRLDNAYPNPFNPTTTINYSVKEAGPVSLRIYNVAGQLVRTLVDETQSPRADGFSVTWDGLNNGGTLVSSGVYFYRLSAKGFTQTKKVVLLK